MAETVVTETAAHGLALARRSVVPVAVLAVAWYLGRDLSRVVALRTTMAIGLGALLVVLSVISPRRATLVLIGWLSLLGLVRRLFSVDWTLSVRTQAGDPLLLIHAAVMAVLFTFAVQRGALRRRTPYTRAALLFTGFLAVSAVNPAQGGPAIGLGGLLLVVVPMLGFVVMRGYADEAFLGRIFATVAWLSVPAAAYGLYQTFAGFPSWDQLWVDNNGYTALSVYGFTRGFGSFSSSAEYGTFLSVGLLAWVGLGRRLAPAPMRVVAVVVIAVAIFYQSSRGILIFAALGAWLMICAWRRTSLLAALAFGAVLLSISPLLVSQLAPQEFAQDTGGALARHQVEGLADPLGPDSTLPGHWERLVDGVVEGFVNPLGSGVGAITIATERFGGKNVSTEVDVSNAAVAAGLPGLVLYLYLFIVGFRLTYATAMERTSGASIVAVGVLTATAFQWTNGGQYAVALLPWLVLGWVDRPGARPDAAVAEVAEVAPDDQVRPPASRENRSR